MRPVAALCVALALAGCAQSVRRAEAEVAQAAAPDPGFQAVDLRRFFPVHQGLVRSYDVLDPTGEKVGTVLEEALDAHRMRTTLDVERGASTFDVLTVNVTADRLEVAREEAKTHEWLLKTPLRPGTRWSYMQGVPAQTVVAGITAIEDVCTPLGRFNRALKVESEGKMRAPGAAEPDVYHVYAWYVRDVGLVQATVESKDPQDRRRVVLESVLDPASDGPLAPPPCETSAD